MYRYMCICAHVDVLRGMPRRKANAMLTALTFKEGVFGREYRG
jgi:hypothetical protein